MTAPLPTVVVIAKECRPGRVKTRLTPPLTPQEAASVAEASLVQTLKTMLEVPASRRVLLFDGHRTPSGAEPYDVVPQASGPLDERLAQAFEALEGPVVLVGMDTPQLDAARLAAAIADWNTDALFGPADDGGFWALGMREPRGDLIRGVVMSTDGTGAEQRRRLADAGLTVTDLWPLRDLDTVDDLRAILDACAHTPFREVAQIALDAAKARAAEPTT